LLVKECVHCGTECLYYVAFEFQVDITSLKLDISYSFQTRWFSGTATRLFSPDGKQIVARHPFYGGWQSCERCWK